VQRGQRTIDGREWLKFLEMHHLISGSTQQHVGLKLREAQYIFVQVNLDDELYRQPPPATTSCTVPEPSRRDWTG
jgi:hypothetical protein